METVLKVIKAVSIAALALGVCAMATDLIMKALVSAAMFLFGVML